MKNPLMKSAKIADFAYFVLSRQQIFLSSADLGSFCGTFLAE